MRTRAKSTRQNLTIDSKIRKVIVETNQKKKGCKKDEIQTRKNLIKTLTLLQQHIDIEKIYKKNNNSQLSASLYQIVKKNMNARYNSLSKSYLRDHASSLHIQKENQPNYANKSAASLLNVSSIHVKKRSNSNLDQYFKEKFGSPAKDQQTIQKKLRVIKALKKSQQIVNKVTTSIQSGSIKQNEQISSILGDMDRNALIFQKLKTKNKKAK